MRSFFRVLSVILLICWMTFIFFLSNQNAESSSQTSGQVIEMIAEKVYPEFKQMTETQKQEIIESWQFVARKTAHVAMFAVLGILAFLTFVSYVDLRFFTRIFWASAVGVLYAATDEYHQRFIAGRSCELRDFLIDTAGVLAAVLLCTAVVKIIAPLRRKTAYAGISKKALKELNCQLYDQLDLAEFRNRKLKKKLTEQEQTIEELETRLMAQKTVAEPPKEVFEEPVIEIENIQDEVFEETVLEPEVLDEILEEPEVLETAEDAPVSDQNEEMEPELETENTDETEPQICEVVEEQDEVLPITVSEEVSEETEKTMKLDEKMNYAAKVIGECVVEVTKVCNKITETAQTETQKELVNLALGRCEVLKSEILKIMSNDMPFEQKKDLIEKQRKDTFDYFDSIIAQMN